MFSAIIWILSLSYSGLALSLFRDSLISCLFSPVLLFSLSINPSK